MNRLIFIALFSWIVGFVACTQPARSGYQLYEVFFGKPVVSCVKILESRDVNAIDDQMLYLHFIACSKETKRIFSLVPYSSKTLSKTEIELSARDSSKGDGMIPSVPVWFDIRKLGDSCIQFYYKWDNKDYAQVGFMSLDSNEVYYREDSW